MEKSGISTNLRVCSGSRRLKFSKPCSQSFIFLSAFATVVAEYKAREWKIRATDTCPAPIVSEGTTIAIEPLFQDSPANHVLDKSDRLANGIMQVAAAIFNDNGFQDNHLKPAIEAFQRK